jgi:uncharacterized protein (DUF885 family)
MTHRSCFLALALLLSGCAHSTSQRDSASGQAATAAVANSAVPVEARQLTVLADEYWNDLIQTFPLYGLFFGVPEAPNDRLGDNSVAALRAWQKKEDRWIQRLGQVDPGPLRGRPDEVTYGILGETLEASRQLRVCHAEYWPLNQQSGLQISLPIIAQLQPIGTPELRTAALARWRQMPRFIDTEITNLREGLRLGYTLPQANARSVLEQLDAILAFSPPESPFAAIVQRDTAPDFRTAVIRVVAEEISPALRRYRDFLAADYIPHARQTTAIAALPHGDDCYRARVRSYTTADLSAQAIHRLGREEMGRIEVQMRTIAERSFGTSDVPALVTRLRDDPQYRFKSREEIIRTAEQAIGRARAAMPRWFGRLPRGDLILDPCKPYEEKKGCPNSYVPGTPDGKRPGRWRINAGDPTSQPRASLEGTAFHEGIPGHHLQITLGQEHTGVHPLVRYSFFSGFGEGWALYAERLADEMGLYSSDLERLGDLGGGQALRAARLVVDPGLHVLGWSRSRAIEYMVAHVPESRDYIESEVDRYIADPGQATAYMIGRLEIERLRHEAEDRLGSQFDLPEFHDRVLESGAVPLPLLRSHIESWIERKLRPAVGR